MRFDRRGLLKTLTALPVIGGLLAILSPLLRYLKPNDGPYQLPLTDQDRPQGGAQVVGKTTPLQQQWDFFYFTYVQQYAQYDATGFNNANTAGLAVRAPKHLKFG